MDSVILILLITVIVSMIAWKNAKIFNELVFYPFKLQQKFNLFPFITSGFIHADFFHLAFNMFTFYLFGNLLIGNLNDFFSFLNAQYVFIILYISALIISIIPTFFSQKNNEDYRCLGASGAVSAVVFASILMNPTVQIGIFMLPFYIPSVIFAPLYLVITVYLSKNAQSGINHSAHFWGSLYGVVFMELLFYFSEDVNLFAYFYKILIGLFSF